jgi:hypothetical protein
LSEEDSSTVLAETVLTAIEHADLNERNFGLTELCDAVPALATTWGTERLKTILVATGCECAKEFVATWIRVRPDDDAPLVALEAARAWLEEPTQERAARSADRSRAALHSFTITKGTDRRPSWPAHAWFARTCAWLADAPRYGWQAVPALLGLTKAGMRASLVNELAAQLREARDRNR